ncbi:MAG TPA: glycosyltransferase family 4 protein [Thermomicrobiales bacterium]|nr:glycosyltransferase family 4 protein [Thermomicrobiales bacterium]
MRIGLIAPVVESVPPARYGGTERVVSVLTEGLVRRGHDVTLFASGDSQTRATLVSMTSRSLRLDPQVRDVVAATLTHVGEAMRRSDEFDVIHNHVDYIAWPFARMARAPMITTAHGRLDLAEIRKLYSSFPEQRLVSISWAQRNPLPHLNWIGNVYNGIDLDNYHFRPQPGEYLVFLGRISIEKRPDRAIEIARDASMRLIIAAKVDDVDRAYWEHAIEPLVNSSRLIEYIGEVNEQEKDELLGGSYAYLFPIDWPEPFGLTMAESMATGTPVITYRIGSTPEIVVDGVTGFVCSSLRGMIEAVDRIPSLDRRACRAHVERHFSPESMVAGYEALYEPVAAGRPCPPRVATLERGVAAVDQLIASDIAMESPLGVPASD